MRICGYFLTITSFFTILGLALLVAAPSYAGVSCSRNDVKVDGSFDGEPFSFDARLSDPETGDNIGLSEQDCVQDSDSIQKARRDGRRAASIGASMDAYGWSEGLNLTLNGANTGLGNDDTYAAGLATGYKHTFGQPLGGVIHSIAGKAAFSADTTGSDYGASVGFTLNFGTF